MILGIRQDAVAGERLMIAAEQRDPRQQRQQVAALPGAGGIHDGRDDRAHDATEDQDREADALAIGADEDLCSAGSR